ncbi:MAG: hypothetical protein AAB968_01005 [Patescibacteria group bacterium]
MRRNRDSAFGENASSAANQQGRLANFVGVSEIAHIPILTFLQKGGKVMGSIYEWGLKITFGVIGLLIGMLINAYVPSIFWKFIAIIGGIIFIAILVYGGYKITS